MYFNRRLFLTSILDEFKLSGEVCFSVMSAVSISNKFHNFIPTLQSSFTPLTAEKESLVLSIKKQYWAGLKENAGNYASKRCKSHRNTTIIFSELGFALAKQ